MYAGRVAKLLRGEGLHRCCDLWVDGCGGIVVCEDAEDVWGEQDDRASEFVCSAGGYKYVFAEPVCDRQRAKRRCCLAAQQLQL